MRKAKRVLLNTHGTQLPEEQKEEEDLPKSPQHVHRRGEVNFRAHRGCDNPTFGSCGSPVRACVRACVLWPSPLLASSCNAAFTLNNLDPPMRHHVGRQTLGALTSNRGEVKKKKKFLVSNLFIGRSFINGHRCNHFRGTCRVYMYAEYVCDTYSINMH